MSNFSEKCKTLLKENGYTVYYLSSVSGLDRTALQRMVTGKRLPNIDFVEKLCHFLMIPKEEKDNLLALYEIEKVGDRVVKLRNIIKESIENIGEFYQYNQQLDFTLNVPELRLEKPLADLVYSENSVEILHLMMYALDREMIDFESPVLYTNIPVTYEKFFDRLFYLCLNSEKRLEIYHMIGMNKDISNTEQKFFNIEIIKKIMPVIFTISDRYHPLYYYTAGATETSSNGMFPYVILTHQYVIELTKNMKKAIIHNNSKYSQIFKKEFDYLGKNCNPLIFRSRSPIEALSNFKDIFNELGYPTHTLEYQPCYMLLDSECKMKPFISTETNLEQMYKNYFSVDHQQLGTQNFKSYYSLEGLNEFVETGRLTGYISSVTRTFCSHERVSMMEELYNNTAHYDKARLVSSDKLKVLKNVVIDVFGSSCVVFFNLMDNNEFACVVVRERLICDVWYDFFSSLEESRMVLSQSESLDCISSFLHK